MNVFYSKGEVCVRVDEGQTQAKSGAEGWFSISIICGYDGTFSAGDSATRGQIAKIVYEAILP
jgi:hypothetical protein